MSATEVFINLQWAERVVYKVARERQTVAFRVVWLTDNHTIHHLTISEACSPDLTIVLTIRVCLLRSSVPEFSSDAEGFVPGCVGT